MGEVYSHLSEEERQVIQIEVGNGTSVRKIARLLGRYYIAGPAQRKADRRRAKPRKPYRLSFGRLWSRVAE